VTLCPAVTLGPGDALLSSTRFVLAYLRGTNRVALPGGIAFCDVRDVARAHVAALTRGRAGERFVLAGHNLGYGEAIEVLHALTGLHRPRVLPMPVLRALATFSELVGRFRSHGLEELTHAYLDRARRFPFYSSAPARDVLGYDVRPLEETLADTVRDLVARGLVAPALARRLPEQLR
jgi:dihydroflavonol-4-reductase